MLTESEAIVLRSLKYNDRANIVEVFTRQYGRVPFLVNIPRSPRAGIKNVLFRPLALLELHWNHRPTASLQRIKAVRCHIPLVSIPYHPYKTATALFLSEFLCHALREEHSGGPIFDYISTSIQWLDTCEARFTNFHLVFLMQLSRFLGFYPNTEHADPGYWFDMLNSCFVPTCPLHNHRITPDEAHRIPLLMRMRYETMHLFSFTYEERNRLLTFINDYYRLHIPSFPPLKSLAVLQDLFHR